jgi:RNA polymerase sigma factor (sigma-70 family)
MSIEQKVDDFPSLTQNWSSDVDWSDLLSRVRNRENTAVDELYSVISRGILFFLRRRLPLEESRDRLHEVFLILIDAIQAGRIEDPRAFPGYAVTVAKRQAWTQIRIRAGGRECNLEDGAMERIFADGKDDPYKILADAEQQSLLNRALGLLHPRQREVLRRFYVYEESKDQICTEMNLTETQFRLLKSRAKTRFGELGRDVLMRRSPARKPAARAQLDETRRVKHVC